MGMIEEIAAALFGAKPKPCCKSTDQKSKFISDLRPFKEFKLLGISGSTHHVTREQLEFARKEGKVEVVVLGKEFILNNAYEAEKEELLKRTLHLSIIILCS